MFNFYSSSGCQDTLELLCMGTFLIFGTDGSDQSLSGPARLALILCSVCFLFAACVFTAAISFSIVLVHT